MHILRAADETHRAHPVAALVHRGLGGGDEARVVGEAEVVIGTEIQGLGAVLEGDFGTLGRGDVAFEFVQAGLADLGERVLQMFLKCSVHSYFCLFPV